VSNADPHGARYATPRDPAARTAGGRVAVIADALGTPLMPWQRYVADVALERHPDNPRRWRYPIVVVTVPRQSGKTTLLRAVAVERAMSAPHVSVFATAQTGKDAHERWKDMVARVELSALGPHVELYKAAATPTLTLPNHSRVRAFAPTPKSLHGYTPHLVIIDEAWSFDAAQGEDLEAAIRPAQITLADRQLWIVSTKGTADSAFLNRWLDVGRAATADRGAGVAYFEWAAAEGADPYDPITWGFHPALGHTITLDDLAAEAEAETSRGNWERSYLNRETVTLETIIDLDRWDALVLEQDPPPSGTYAMAYEVAYDMSGACVWASWRDDADDLHVRVVYRTPDVRTLVPWLAAARQDLDYRRPLYADDGGPARQVTDELRRLQVEVETLPARDYATACATFMRHVREGSVHHAGDPALREAITRAVTKLLGDQPAFDRRRASGPIDDLVAATVAVRAADHGAQPSPRPEVFV
jgi:phage terminase large subunit-like protein